MSFKKISSFWNDLITTESPSFTSDNLFCIHPYFCKVILYAIYSNCDLRKLLMAIVFSIQKGIKLPERRRLKRFPFFILAQEGKQVGNISILFSSDDYLL